MWVTPREEEIVSIDCAPQLISGFVPVAAKRGECILCVEYVRQTQAWLAVSVSVMLAEPVGDGKSQCGGADAMLGGINVDLQWSSVNGCCCLETCVATAVIAPATLAVLRCFIVCVS